MGFSRFHAGVVISDSDTLVMSANIKKRGLESGFELGITLEGKRAKEIKKKVSAWIDNISTSSRKRLPRKVKALINSGDLNGHVASCNSEKLFVQA